MSNPANVTSFPSLAKVQQFGGPQYPNIFVVGYGPALNGANFVWTTPIPAPSPGVAQIAVTGITTGCYVQAIEPFSSGATTAGNFPAFSDATATDLSDSGLSPPSLLKVSPSTRAGLAALTKAQSASAIYQNIYITESGFEAAYHYDATSTAPVDGTFVIAPSDAGVSGRWLINTTTKNVTDMLRGAVLGQQPPLPPFAQQHVINMISNGANEPAPTIDGVVGATIVSSTKNVLYGVRSWEITIPEAGTVRMIWDPPNENGNLNFGPAGFIGDVYFFDDGSAISGTETRIYTCDPPGSNPDQLWDCITTPGRVFTDGYNFSGWSGIQGITDLTNWGTATAIYKYITVTKATTLRLCRMYAISPPQALVVFSEEVGFRSFEPMRLQLEALGVPITYNCAPMRYPSAIGTSAEIITKEELKAIIWNGNGHAASTHSWNQEDNTLLDASQVEALGIDAQQWVQNPDNVGYDPCWKGAWQGNSCPHPENLRPLYLAFATTTAIDGYSGLPPADWYNLPRHTFSGRTEAEIRAWFAALSKAHQMGIPYVHGVSETDIHDITEAQKAVILDCIAQYSAAGTIKFVTMEYVLARYGAQRHSNIYGLDKQEFPNPFANPVLTDDFGNLNNLGHVGVGEVADADEILSVLGAIRSGAVAASAGSILLAARYGSRWAQSIITTYSDAGIGPAFGMFQSGAATWLSSYSPGAIGRSAIIADHTGVSVWTAPSQDVAWGDALTTQPTRVFFIGLDGTPAFHLPVGTTVPPNNGDMTVDCTDAGFLTFRKKNAAGSVYRLSFLAGGRQVADLPAAATVVAGSRAFVTDATATTFLSVVAGGGANNVPVVNDGTNWVIG